MSDKVEIRYEHRNTKHPYTVRWFGDYNPDTGNQKRHCKSFTTEAEAEVFRAGLIMKFSKGARRDPPNKVSLAAFIKDFVKVKKKEVSANAIDLYENTIRRLFDYFGQKTLVSRIDTREADKFIASLKRLDGKQEPLSNWARDRVLRHCRTMFGTAVTWKLITENPFKLVKRPRCISRPWHYLTAAEFQNLMKEAPLRCKAIYALAYGCALRDGEIASLKWDNIDFAAGKHGEVRIYNHPPTATLPPFNIKDYEERIIPLPKFVADILVDLKTYNEATDDTPYVVLNEQQYKTLLAKWKRFIQQKRAWKSKDFKNNTLTTFKRHAAKAGIVTTKSLSIQVLRKNCITNWANRIQNPEAVRKLAGHSDIATTMKYYSMLTDDIKAKAADVIDELLSPVT